MNDHPNPKAEAITRAIGYTENGGKPNLKSAKKGKTGEMKSLFQFEPETWKNYSKQVFGKENVPLNNDTETYVVNHKVSQWLEKGYTPQQIFSMWNAGAGEPNAYTGKFSDGKPSSGVNSKYGVKYSVPEYVDKAMGYLNQVSANTPQKPIAQATPAPQPTPNPIPTGSVPGLLPAMSNKTV